MSALRSKQFSTGPIALTTTTNTNIFNPGTTTGGTNCTSSPYNNLRAVITHFRVTNNSAGALTFALWKGATGTNTAGKEFIWGGIASGGALTNGVSIPANGQLDVSCAGEPFDTTDYLVGGASGSGLTIVLSGELGIA
jgi:hypothetical protein